MDASELAQAYERHSPEIRAYLRTMTRDPEAAEDLAQEAFLRLHLEVTAGRAPDNVRAWLYRVAANEAVSRGRRAQVAARHAPALGVERDVASTEELVVGRERDAMVRSALATLRPKDREVIVLAAAGVGARAGRAGRSQPAGHADDAVGRGWLRRQMALLEGAAGTADRVPVPGSTPEASGPTSRRRVHDGAARPYHPCAVQDREGQAGFVGQVAEMARLEDALAEAVRRSPRAIVVAGEPAPARRDWSTSSWLAPEQPMCGSSREPLPLGDGGPPFAPVVAILRSLTRSVPPANLPAVLGPGRSELARPSRAVDRAADVPRPTASGDPTAQVRLFELVAGSLDRLARMAPLIVAVEDVHWADRASRDMVDFLVRGLRDERLLLILTVRTDTLGPDDLTGLGRRAWTGWRSSTGWTSGRLTRRRSATRGRGPRQGAGAGASSNASPKRAGGNAFLVGGSRDGHRRRRHGAA
jgi:RNA polymerase sigma factor (sigma-70 family)